MAIMKTLNVEDVSNDQDGWRWYTIDGKKYVSVTTVLDCWVPPQLKQWFIKTTPEAITKKKEETAQKGTDIHAKTEAGTEDRFSEMLKKEEMTVQRSEIVVCSKHGWAGRFDHEVLRNGRLGILDVKTGRFGPQSGAQLGAYTLAANENGGNVEWIGVASVPRDPKKPAAFYDYTKNFDNCQYGWVTIFDFWKFMNYKKLATWEFFGPKTTISYRWEK